MFFLGWGGLSGVLSASACPTAGHVPSGRGFDTSLAYFFQINDYWTQGMSGSEGACCNKITKTRPSELRDLWLDDRPAKGLNGTAYLWLGLGWIGVRQLLVDFTAPRRSSAPPPHTPHAMMIARGHVRCASHAAR